MTGLAIDRALHRQRLRSHPLQGTVLDGKYKVGELIGRGGRGFVFGAQHVATRQPVAIKVVTDPLAFESLLRLEQEARLVGSFLRHPNICSVLEVGHVDRIGPYVVMERLFGETLGHRIRSGGPIPIVTALHLALQVVSALRAAHERQIIHRDIKPSNIFVTGRKNALPVAKVLDFGYAKKLDEPISRLSRPGLIVGTPAYIPPEATRGLPFTHLGDIFACGTVLFEMLTGRLPFPGTTELEVQRAKASGTRSWLLDLRPDAPPRLAWVIHRALSAEPLERPRSAEELSRELRKINDALATADDDETSVIRNRRSRVPSFATPVPALDTRELRWDPPSSSSSAGRRR